MTRSGSRFEPGEVTLRRARTAEALLRPPVRSVAAIAADLLDPPAPPPAPVDLAAWRARSTSSDPKVGAAALAAEVRRLRELTGLTRAELGRLAGLGDGYVGKVERGQGRVQGQLPAAPGRRPATCWRGRRRRGVGLRARRARRGRVGAGVESAIWRTTDD
jgi:hypothetical protein